jgi:DNA-binding SARP family transcriptional activator
VLWIDAPEDRAFARLRSALWRLKKPGYRLVEATSNQLRLAPDVAVDYQDATALAQGLLGGRASAGADDVDWAPLGGELLPDWYDDWVLMERERYRQLGLHALEALAQRYIDASEPGRALAAALAAVAGEPLRESAHRAVIRVHLAEGNGGEALRQYELCRRLLRDRLGLEPSAQLESLVRPLTHR